jgi:DNA modification methylase
MAQRTRAAKPNLKIEYLATSALTPNPENVRLHTPNQIARLGRIITKLGWSSPIVIDEHGLILAGHARLEAARLIAMPSVPCVRLVHLDPAQKKTLAIADNKMTDASRFDDQALRDVLIELTNLDFDVELTGFETGEIDFRIDGGGGAGSADPADSFAAPNPGQPAVSRLGDLCLLGAHRLLCGNALESASYEALLGADRAQMVFCDPPYNVAIDGNVSNLMGGKERRKHREFAMAYGEMAEPEFRGFLATGMTHAATFSMDGSIALFCIDWRHVRTMLEAADGIYAELKNICVWNKQPNAGMGSLYRSQHEFIVVLKKGSAPHQNNVQLGKHGRWRTNVWNYPGATFGATGDADLASHPTVKPLALVADAIRDVSKRGGIVLDPFVGSGTTILAAERTGRRAAAIEIDPLYVDTAIRRWQAFTGKTAVLAGDGRSFEEIRAERVGDADAPASPADGGR